MSGERLEYVERIAYVHDMKVTLLNVAEFKIESQHSVRDVIRWQGEISLQTCPLGSGLMIAISEKGPWKKRYFTTTMVFDKTGKYINSQTEDGKLTKQERRQIMFQKVADIKKMKKLCVDYPGMQFYNWDFLNSQQMHMLFPGDTRDEAFVEIIDNTIHLKIGEKTEIIALKDVRHNSIEQKLKSHLLDLAIVGTYCYEDKSILILFQCGKNYAVEQWAKKEHGWIIASSRHLALRYTGKTSLDKIYRMKCSKRYLYLDAKYPLDQMIGSERIIIIVDRKTYCEVGSVKGMNVVYRDDYLHWLTDGVNLLKGVDVLNKMSSDILTIILSFVD